MPAPVPVRVAAPVLDIVTEAVFVLLKVMLVRVTVLANDIAVVPEIAWAFVLNVALPAEKEVPLLVIPPLKIIFPIVVTAVEVNAPVTLTLPINKSIPLSAESVKLPVPVVVPEIVRLLVLE